MADEYNDGKRNDVLNAIRNLEIVNKNYLFLRDLSRGSGNVERTVWINKEDGEIRYDINKKTAGLIPLYLKLNRNKKRICGRGKNLDTELIGEARENLEEAVSHLTRDFQKK